MLWPLILSCSAETAAAMRFAPSPTLMLWLHSSRGPAMRMVTAEATNRRSVVSAISCNGRSASPEALATARRTSALACCCIRAILSRAFSPAVSAAAGSFGLRGSDLVGFDLAGFGWRDPTREVPAMPDLRPREPARPAVLARFPTLFLILAIFPVPLAKLPDPALGANICKAKDDRLASGCLSRAALLARRQSLCTDSRHGWSRSRGRPGNYELCRFPYTLSARFSNAPENLANAASNIDPISTASIRLLNS